MPLPQPRGPLTAELIAVLTGDDPAARGLGPAARLALRSTDVLTDDDLQLYLTLCYEMHYRGLDGVSDSWEWNPALLLVRSLVERVFEAALHRAAGSDRPLPAGPDAVADELFAMTAFTPGPSLSGYLGRTATAEQFREFLTVRSAYHLKEADPHTFAIPRLAGAAKAAMVEVQADEYGGGRTDRMHATLFADTMRALGLDARYGALIDRVPAVALASLNAMSLFGLHRRLLGAIVGHLAAFEMTSTLPNRRYGQGLRRLGFGERATRFFDEHVEADAVHEQIAGRSLAGGLAAAQPALIGDIMFGARACLALEGMVADHLLGSWRRGESALR
jgi:hypothetical protein